MLCERQRLVLTLLDYIGGPLANTDFQKLLFLYTRECETEPTYEFVPYKFGAFSFTSYAEKRRLADAGLLTKNRDEWRLTKAGVLAARYEPVMPLVVSHFCRQYSKLRGKALIAHQYRKYPYFATRSEILESIVTDAESRALIRKALPRRRRAALVTIGYQSRSLEGYLNLLLRASVTVLCDVRRNPISRKYGFSKETLRKNCTSVGIRYEHLPRLGVDSKDRQGLRTQKDYDKLFLEYKQKNLPERRKELAIIRAWLRTGQRVALTCFELLPNQCHRHCVAEAVAKRGSFPTVHL